jgi:hypothetical protein
MWHIVFRIKSLLHAVLELGRSWGLPAIMKLMAVVVDEMEALIHDSLQCQSSLDKYIKEYEPDSGSPSSSVNVPSPFKFEHVPTPHIPRSTLRRTEELMTTVISYRHSMTTSSLLTCIVVLTWCHILF